MFCGFYRFIHRAVNWHVSAPQTGAKRESRAGPLPPHRCRKAFPAPTVEGEGEKIPQFGEDILTHYRYIVKYVYRGTLYRYISRFSCTKYLNI